MLDTQIGKDIRLAKELLDNGELVAIPTETVYGLAANALNDKAIAKIYEAKQRPHFNPLILHVDSLSSLKLYVTFIPSKLEILMKAFMPGSLTVLLPKSNLVSDIVTAGSSKVAIRIPQHRLTLDLLSSLAYPLAAPSANPSGYVSPTSAEHVYVGLAGKIPYILDGGQTEIGLESTIVGYDESSEEVLLYRWGGIDKETLEITLGEPIRESILHSQPQTPGQLKSHYATQTPLYLGDIKLLASGLNHDDCVLISYSNPKGIPCKREFVLSEKGDTAEAARNLFYMLREADALEATCILCEYAPNEGLGKAINDRLQRAQYILK